VQPHSLAQAREVGVSLALVPVVFNRRPTDLERNNDRFAVSSCSRAVVW